MFKGWKTYATGAATILTAVAMTANGGMDLQTCVQTCATALLAIFLRNGVATTGGK